MVPAKNKQTGCTATVTAEQGTKRKRGVCASRVSLARALAEAGLRSQAALAERIADLEGLDTVPKDVVSRVFRELPVEPRTLERVARALGVDAYTLYKTAREETRRIAPPGSPPPAPPTRPSHWRLTATIAAALVALTASGWWLSRERPEQDASIDAPVRRPLGLGTPTLVVLPIEGDTGGALAAILRKELGDTFAVASSTAAALTRDLDPVSASTRLRTDVTLDGEIVTVGRLSAVRLFLFADGVRQQVWAHSLPAVTLSGRLDDIAAQASLAVRRTIGLPVPTDAVRHFPLAPVQDDYLQGEYYLDRPSNELNVRRAQGHFEAALRQDANYARAHAGLCQTLLEAHWMDDEERALNDAARACGQAMQLDPEDSVVAGAHAHFLSRTGRNDEAIAIYGRTAATHPSDAAVLAGLATVRLQAYRQGGDRAMLTAAKDAARRAAEVDPVVWKPLHTLAILEWFDGDVAAAIAISEQALARDENEYVLANLGTFYLCDGAFEKARDVYNRARELDPASYVGDEFLGMAHYFLGDFERSAILRRRAIERVSGGEPEIHEMWGNLGDSYRQTGDREQAVAAYLRAAEIAERDYLRGTAPAADRAARTYYYTMLDRLAPGTVSGEVLTSIADDLDSITAELASAIDMRRLAQIYLERGEIDKARQSLRRATETCRGYARLPDLAALADGS